MPGADAASRSRVVMPDPDGNGASPVEPGPTINVSGAARCIHSRKILKSRP